MATSENSFSGDNIITLRIEGMMCQNSCGSTVHEALLSHPSVSSVEVSYAVIHLVDGSSSSSSSSSLVGSLISSVEEVGFDAYFDSAGEGKESNGTIAPELLLHIAWLPGTAENNDIDDILHHRVFNAGLSGVEYRYSADSSLLSIWHNGGNVEAQIKAKLRVHGLVVTNDDLEMDMNSNSTSKPTPTTSDTTSSSSHGITVLELQLSGSSNNDTYVIEEFIVPNILSMNSSSWSRF